MFGHGLLPSSNDHLLMHPSLPPIPIGHNAMLAFPQEKISHYTTDYMCDLVSVYNPKRCGLRSGIYETFRLCTVKANSAKYGYMCYSLAAPALWNQLPENIRSAETFATFKKSLKTFIFKKILMLIVCIHMSSTPLSFSSFF